MAVVLLSPGGGHSVSAWNGEVLTVAITKTPESVIVTAIDRAGFDFETIRSGQGLAVGALGFTEGQDWGPGPADAKPADMAFEQMVDAAIEEVLPQVRDLIADAIERRLPWRWEG
ncbi:MAG: hypothetical protein H0W81_11670 [Chloroflexi bacterium]|nr:hypothetical protein [Chloroflexota bacterium]